MFVFIKKIFYIGSSFLSSLVSTTSLSVTLLNCFLMKNQECKVRPEILILIVTIPYFTLLVLK